MKFKSKSKLKTVTKPKVGDSVIIIIKPYHKKIYKKGIVKRVLTKKKFHSRGHKVQLTNNIIGRIIKILTKRRKSRKLRKLRKLRKSGKMN
jgi:uncharacterized repeat protein (TIGR03833 family)